MMIYLAKMTHNLHNRKAYKVGHTQGKFAERFSSDEYKDFNIERVDHIFLSADNWAIAKAATQVLEEAIRVVIPAKDPSFIIEDYFGVDPGSLKISGVTEMCFPQTLEEEEYIIRAFKKFKAAESKFKRILKDY